MNTKQTPITGNERKQDLAEPIKALSDFYEAFNNRDLAKMANIWAQTDEIAMDNPVGGITRGWEEIKAVYEHIFNGKAKAYVEFYDYTIHQQREMFYAVGRERGEFRIGEIVVNLAIRTSRIFQLMNGQWRQVHHHGSIEEPELLARYQRAVRKGV
jgi:ketosteroid isomerase-like protein